ncbi:MAG: hypothetical protein JXN65_12170 [Clostridia bacterium]|nr:hypothetical protein [Clostridia bacterium]
MYIFIAIAGLILIIAIITFIEFQKNSRIKIIPARPKAEGRDDGFDKIMNSNLHELLYKLEEKISLDEADFSTIESTCSYLDYRFDCVDFRMQTLLRMLFKHSDKIPEKYIEMIKNSLLSSKFFMDQPGEDSMCFWSENHLLLFAAAEYLTGQLYEDEIFTNDNLTGKRHKEIALERINIWLKQRFYYGFTEWYSNTYYEEDIAPLSNLIDFCDNSEVVTRSKMIMDILLHDIATQSHMGSFTSTSGRQYELGKKSGENSALRNITYSVWGYKMGYEKKGLDQNFIYINNYKVPDVIKKIGLDSEAGIIKASSGLNLTELVKEMPKGQSLERVMMQWAMESFSNKEVVTDTIKYVHKNHMLSNEFLNGFKLIDLSILKYTGLLPVISGILRPFSDGVAIQRANTYTFKTKDYMLATAQNHHPGEFGDQQHIWSATLADNLCIFTTHPAPPFSDDGALSASPNYWVGNGINPHSVQDKNVNITIYSLDGKKGFMEKKRDMKTHCYFPKSLFNEVELSNKVVTGRRGDAFIAIRSGSKMTMTADELLQEGELTYWVTELSSRDKETFEEFSQRIRSNELSFDSESKTLCYATTGRDYRLKYKGDFNIDGKKQDTEYKRFESKYSDTQRESQVIEISFDGSSLMLDYENCVRNE